MDSSHEKYIKYKTKYLEAKDKIDVLETENKKLKENQEGGTKKEPQTFWNYGCFI